MSGLQFHSFLTARTAARSKARTEEPAPGCGPSFPKRQYLAEARRLGLECRGQRLLMPIVPIPMLMAVTSPIMVVVRASILPNDATTAERD